MGCAKLGYFDYLNADKSKAKAFLENQCDHKNMRSCYDLGEISRKEGDLDRAQSLLEKTCDEKLGIGCVELGTLEKMNGHGDAANSKIHRGTGLLQTACKAGDVYSCTELKLLASGALNAPSKGRPLNPSDLGPNKRL
jgi:TPR repeat protein